MEILKATVGFLKPNEETLKATVAILKPTVETQKATVGFLSTVLFNLSWTVREKGMIDGCGEYLLVCWNVQAVGHCITGLGGIRTKNLACLKPGPRGTNKVCGPSAAWQS